MPTGGCGVAEPASHGSSTPCPPGEHKGPQFTGKPLQLRGLGGLPDRKLATWLSLQGADDLEQVTALLGAFTDSLVWREKQKGFFQSSSPPPPYTFQLLPGKGAAS